MTDDAEERADRGQRDLPDRAEREQPAADRGPERDPERLPPDPAAYDSPRAQIARAKGLEAPYIAGGRDPDPETGRREERHYGKLLFAMVLALILGGFVIGTAINLVVGTP